MFNPHLTAPTGVSSTRCSNWGLLTVSFALVCACVRLKLVSLVTLLATSLSVFVGCQRQMVIPSGVPEGQSGAVLPGFQGVVCLATFYMRRRRRRPLLVE